MHSRDRETNLGLADPHLTTRSPLHIDILLSDEELLESSAFSSCGRVRIVRSILGSI